MPQQPAGDEPAADQGSAVQNADAAANAVVGDAPDADGSPASDGSVSDGDLAPSTDSAPATQSDAVQGDLTSPLSDTQPEFSLAAWGGHRRQLPRSLVEASAGLLHLRLSGTPGSICTSHKKSPRGPLFSGCAGFAMVRVTGNCGYFAEALSLSAP